VEPRFVRSMRAERPQRPAGDDQCNFTGCCARAPLHRGISARQCPVWVIFDRSGQFCLPVDVRFAPKADKVAGTSVCPLCAETGCEQSQQMGWLFDHFVGGHLHD